MKIDRKVILQILLVLIVAAFVACGFYSILFIPMP
jgi:hypothetical protein